MGTRDVLVQILLPEAQLSCYLLQEAILDLPYSKFFLLLLKADKGNLHHLPVPSPSRLV